MAELIYDPTKHDGPMQVVAFGSGSCSTIEAILAHQKMQKLEGDSKGFEVVAIFTDNLTSGAHAISQREGIPLIYHDFEGFMTGMGLNPRKKKDRKDPYMRTAFDARTKEMLEDVLFRSGKHIDIIALAGYMLRLYAPITEDFAGRVINSHPADLSILREDGKRKYTGDNAVFDAITSGETETRTTIHVVRDEVDAGEILTTSAPLKVRQGLIGLVKTLSGNTYEITRIDVLSRFYTKHQVHGDKRVFSVEALTRCSLQEVADAHQDWQKEHCDHPAYCFTLDALAQGEFALADGVGALKTVLLNGEPMPYSGVRL